MSCFCDERTNAISLGPEVDVVGLAEVAVELGASFKRAETRAPCSAQRSCRSILSHIDRGSTVLNDELVPSRSALGHYLPADHRVLERTAAGMNSKFAAPGRVSHLEAAPWHFRRWLVQRVGDST